MSYKQKQKAVGIMGDPSSYASHVPRRLFHRLIVFSCVLCLLAVILFAPFMAGLRSIAVMSVYDSYCSKSSLPSALGLTLEMPLGKMDFYPLLVTFNDDRGMSSWLGQPVRFTVDYSVADFSFLSSHSPFYDPESPLYNAYIGAYYLQGLGKPADQQVVMQVAAFDQRCLALPAIGLDPDHAVFTTGAVQAASPKIELSGYEWQRYDAAISTNGPEHQRKSFQTGYLLLGDPPPARENYPPREMAGRIYVTYLEDLDLTIGLYILARDDAVLDRIDRQVLSGTRLTWKAPK